MTPTLYSKIYSREEYLEMEEKSLEKHEYRNGEIVLVTGGTTNHNEIASNLCTYLKLALKGQNFSINTLFSNWSKTRKINGFSVT